jgi:hypothetical protein
MIPTDDLAVVALGLFQDPLDGVDFLRRLLLPPVPHDLSDCRRLLWLGFPEQLGQPYIELGAGFSLRLPVGRRLLPTLGRAVVGAGPVASVRVFLRVDPDFADLVGLKPGARHQAATFDSPGPTP